MSSDNDEIFSMKQLEQLVGDCDYTWLIEGIYNIPLMDNKLTDDWLNSVLGRQNSNSKNLLHQLEQLEYLDNNNYDMVNSKINTRTITKRKGFERYQTVGEIFNSSDDIINNDRFNSDNSNNSSINRTINRTLNRTSNRTINRTINRNNDVVNSSYTIKRIAKNDTFSLEDNELNYNFIDKDEVIRQKRISDFMRRKEESFLPRTNSKAIPRINGTKVLVKDSQDSESDTSDILEYNHFDERSTSTPLYGNKVRRNVTFTCTKPRFTASIRSEQNQSVVMTKKDKKIYDLHK